MFPIMVMGMAIRIFVETGYSEVLYANLVA